MIHLHRTHTSRQISPLYRGLLRQRALLPVKEAAVPVKETHLLVKEAAVSVKEAAVPVKETHLLVKEAAVSVKENCPGGQGGGGSGQRKSPGCPGRSYFELFRNGRGLGPNHFV